MSSQGEFINSVNIRKMFIDASNPQELVIEHSDGSDPTIYQYTSAALCSQDFANLQRLINASAISSGYFINNITPDPFDISTSTIMINGSGFVQSLVGNLYIDDSNGAGSIDANGYFMTCSFQTPNALSAVFGGSGDGILGPGAVFVYYKDTNGVISNILVGQNTSGTIIQI